MRLEIRVAFYSVVFFFFNRINDSIDIFDRFSTSCMLRYDYFGIFYHYREDEKFCSISAFQVFF